MVRPDSREPFHREVWTPPLPLLLSVPMESSYDYKKLLYYWFFQWWSILGKKLNNKFTLHPNGTKKINFTRHSQNMHHVKACVNTRLFYHYHESEILCLLREFFIFSPTPTPKMGDLTNFLQTQLILAKFHSISFK